MAETMHFLKYLNCTFVIIENFSFAIKTWDNLQESRKSQSITVTERNMHMDHFFWL